MDKIKTLIVDDSAFMRKLIQDILSVSARIEIVGTARNGEDALKKIKELTPDVVTMDVEMPVLDGLEALKLIMKEAPVPVVMLSSTTKEGAENTFLAMQYGAVDFIAKPSGAISLDLQKVGKELIEKVISASKANIKNLLNNTPVKKRTELHAEEYSKIDLKASSSKRPIANMKWKPAAKKLICIGTSTGGPRALQNVLTKFPADIKAPILVVQHMPPGFTKSLAARMDALSQIAVKEAEDGELLQNGTAYIAPGGYHLKIRTAEASRLAVQLDQSPPENGHRPSVDILFKSAGSHQEYAKIAVIMTGMGADGTKGIIELKNRGNVMAIVESEETSIVYGMPKAAFATKLIDEVQNVEDIADAIMKYV